MTYRDILLQIDTFPEPTPAAAIDSAVNAARALGATLSAVAVQVDIPLKSNALADRLVGLSGLEAAWEASSVTACNDALAHFATRAKAAGVFGSSEAVRLNLYRVDDAVAQRSRTHDLCMIPITDPYDGQLELTQAVIFGSGRPVLAFKADVPVVTDGRLGDAIVLWDGSRAAARALADSLPLLALAGSVRVVTFTGEKPSARPGQGAAVVKHLASHGVAAMAVDVDTGGRRIGLAIDAYLAAQPANLLVMGAYGRSRIVEFVLGGATEHVLRHPPCAVLLSH